MRKKIKNILFFILFILFNLLLYSQSYVRILTPNGGWNLDRVINISGETNANSDSVRIVYNGIPLRLPVYDGRFSREFVASPGVNNIYAEIDNGNEILTDSITFYSTAPAKALKIILMWDTDGTDLDLHIIEPGNEECYYGYRQTKIGGSLDVDITTGFGPEVYTLATPTKGTYMIKVHYYSDNGNPQTQAIVYVVKNEGTSNEEIIKFETMLTQTNAETFIDVVSLE